MQIQVRQLGIDKDRIRIRIHRSNGNLGPIIVVRRTLQTILLLLLCLNIRYRYQFFFSTLVSSRISAVSIFGCS
jgi:hypothetical protein